MLMIDVRARGAEIVNTAAADRRSVTAALPLWADPVELDEINLDYAATTPALIAAVEAAGGAPVVRQPSSGRRPQERVLDDALRGIPLLGSPLRRL